MCELSNETFASNESRAGRFARGRVLCLNKNDSSPFSDCNVRSIADVYSRISSKRVIVRYWHAASLRRPLHVRVSDITRGE